MVNTNARRLVPTKNANVAALTQQVRALTRRFAALNQPRTPNARNARRRAVQRANGQLRSIPRALVDKEMMMSRGTPSRLTTFAQRGQGHYDAYVQSPDSMVLGAQVGPCTPVEGFARFTFPGSAGVEDKTYYRVTGNALPTAQLTSNAQLVVFNPGSSTADVACAYSLVDSATAGYAHVLKQTISCAAFSDFGPVHNNLAHDVDVHDPAHSTIMDPTGRIESIPIRGSMRIRNITENFSVGGEVRIMRFNGGLNIGHDVDGNTDLSDHMGVAEFLSICDMMRESKRAHTFDAAELRESHQVNTYPADSIRSHTFKDDTSFMESVLNPKYCTVLVLIEDFKPSSGFASGQRPNNTYSFGFVTQRAARFRPGTILHNKQIVPAVNQNAHKTGVHVEEAAPPARPSTQSFDIMGALQQTEATLRAAHPAIQVARDVGQFTGTHIVPRIANRLGTNSLAMSQALAGQSGYGFLAGRKFMG